MNSEVLSLGLQSPWEVRKVNFIHPDSARKELHLQIGFPAGSRLANDSGFLCGVQDTAKSGIATYMN